MVKLWIADKSDPAQIPWELDFFCSTMLKILVLLSCKSTAVLSSITSLLETDFQPIRKHKCNA